MFDDVDKVLRLWLRALLPFAVLLLLILASPGARQAIFSAPLDYWLSDKFLFVGALWAVFVACVIKGEGVWGEVMKNAYLGTLGRWSYSIYLFHWFVYSIVMERGRDSVLAMVVGFFCAIMFGGVVYRFVERPIELLRYNINFGIVGFAAAWEARRKRQALC